MLSVGPTAGSCAESVDFAPDRSAAAATAGPSGAVQLTFGAVPVQTIPASRTGAFGVVLPGGVM